MNQTRLMKTARTIDLFLRIIQALLIMGSFLFILIGLARLFGVDEWFAVTSTELTLGFVKLTLSDRAMPDSAVLKGSMLFSICCSR